MNLFNEQARINRIEINVWVHQFWREPMKGVSGKEKSKDINLRNKSMKQDA